MNTFLIEYASGKALDVPLKVFKQIIDSRVRKRHEQFFEAFCKEVQLENLGKKSNYVDVLLNAILDDPDRSEVLFDAYRKLSLAKSSFLGPRIIGILTAKISIEERDPEYYEDSFFDVAEALTDKELNKFLSFYEENKLVAEKKKKGAQFSSDGALEVKWSDEQQDSSWPNEQNISVGPLNLGELGSWGIKLGRLGVIFSDIRERKWDYEEDSERHIDSSGTVREISCWVIIPQDYIGLANLIKKAQSMLDKA